MIEINLLKSRGWEYNGQHSFVWYKVGRPWFALVVRRGEPGGILSRVQKAKGTAVVVFN